MAGDGEDLEDAVPVGGVSGGLENDAPCPICCYHHTMTAMPKSEPLCADDAEREAKIQAIREARESVEREGTISHADMMAWLRSLGTADERPPPEPCK